MTKEEQTTDEKYYSVTVECINKFHNYFPDIDISSVDNLTVKEVNDVSDMYIMEYDISSHSILINKNNIDKILDLKHTMMHELVHVISANKDTASCGLLSPNKKWDETFSGINEGITELVARTVMPTERAHYFSPVLLTNLISKMVGIDVILDSYFNNNTEQLITSLGEKLGSEEVAKIVLKGITDETFNELNGFENKSMLGELEFVLMERYISNNEVTKEKLEEFDKILLTDSTLLEEEYSNIFTSVNDVRKLIDDKKQKIELQNMFDTEEYSIENELGGKRQ